MPGWKPSLSDIFKTIVHQVERQYNWIRAKARRTLGWINPVKILPYRGYGNAERLFLMGRVLEDRPVGSPREEDSWWRNVYAMYQRFATDEISDVRVRATFGRQSKILTTDAEGYFRLNLKLAQPLKAYHSWQSVSLELLDEVRQGQGPVTAEGHVLVPQRDCRFGVISDVDDTIIRSQATDFLKLARITFLNNVRTRTPLPGVSRFYRALEQNPDDGPPNPFFYVSSSAWNLYDLLEEFLDLHDIPAGPLMLRDLGLDDNQLIKSGHEHKLEKIERIMRMYGELPFVLIGDAGQDDPVIYREVVRRAPDRVLAIYIRAVGSQKRNERVRRMVQDSGQRHVPMLLVEDVDEALAHAESVGLVNGDRVRL